MSQAPKINRFLCVHGHFYQPPRENPWLGSIERQESAAPFHDWNEKITAECYAPNAVPHGADGEGDVREFPSNYSRMSFDFGPTLLSWLERNAPRVYAAILAADQESQKRFSGHGSAIAQAYNHMILPLANARDRQTQVLWGIRDFEHRFRRFPEGMWLPEAAVDLETLEVLARHGIRFTILSPQQAARIRRIGDSSWEDVENGAIDAGRPYQAVLPSGRRIVLFFYHGPLSHAVAFGLLEKGGGHLARCVASLFSDEPEARLLNMATDGETYGHHHRDGELALAVALDAIESQHRVWPTNYGEFLASHPPTHEVEILENTSWSCPHGLKRWSEDCPCQTGMHPGWSQAWRDPLRQSLNWLRDALAERFEERSAKLLRNPWEARNDSLSLFFDNSVSKVEAFFSRHARHSLSPGDRAAVLQMLEMQRCALFMFTSCGWFFDDVSGLETRQILQYAGRAIELAQEVFGESFEAPFLDQLENAKSNARPWRDAREVYASFVNPYRSRTAVRGS